MELEQWSFRWLEGSVCSYLRGGDMGKSSLKQIDGMKRRIESSYGVPETVTKRAIASAINQSPNRNSLKADELRKRYLQ